jgi:hypothetical protein
VDHAVRRLKRETGGWKFFQKIQLRELNQCK